MIWIPGVDEIPMSVSHCRNGTIGLTVKVLGEATEALCNLEEGDRVRFRGPFGQGFKLEAKRPVLVAGGVGSAPLLLLASTYSSMGVKGDAIIGAKSKDELTLIQEFENLGWNVYIATDDGSNGFKGTASDLLEKKLKVLTLDFLYTCGPEKMLFEVIRIAESVNLPGQAALERLMKCGIGICGSCAINQKLVCRDGPVFDFKELRKISEFGKAKRDAAGRLRPSV